jgi:rhodanese-related sulfurtransferase
MTKRLADFVAEARARIQEIDATELDEMIENHEDVLIVDVREADEFEQGHIPGALNVPRGLLEGAADPNYKHRVDILCAAHERTVILYCQTGGRSAMAADTLNQMGFAKAWNLAGGIELWDAEGLPVIKD